MEAVADTLQIPTAFGNHVGERRALFTTVLFAVSIGSLSRGFNGDSFFRPNDRHYRTREKDCAGTLM